MSDQFELNAEVRQDVGKGASRRLRRLADQIPAIIYGAGKDAQPLTVIRKDLEKALENEAFYTQVINIKVGGSAEKAILKDLQRHPSRDRVMHADFLRIDENVAIKVHVPLHFINEETCVGVKLEGGVIQHQVTDVEVECLPGNIPAYLEVDMLKIAIGDIVHLSDIVLPEGVTSVELALGEDHDLAVASVIAPRGAAEGEEDEAAADTGGAAAADDDAGDDAEGDDGEN